MKGGAIGVRIGGSIGKSGPIIGGGGPERGGGFTSVGFARGFGKVGGERAASANALKFNASMRFSEGGLLHAVNTNFRQFENPRPLHSSGILRTEKMWIIPQTKGRTLEQAQNTQPHTQGRTLNEKIKAEAEVRNQALETSAIQRLTRIFGNAEKAKITVLELKKSAGVNLNHPGGVTEGVTESATRNKVATRTKERTQIVFEHQQKIAAQKTKEKSLKRDKKTKSQSRIKTFQEYLAAKFARVNQARKIFERIEDENRQKGENIVAGTDVAREFTYTKDQESLAISQLGKVQKDGSHSATREDIANQKYVTLEKLEGIVNAHVPTEIVEKVTTRQSTDRELAEVFDDTDKIPSALSSSAGEKIVYINASVTKAEKTTEEISGKTEEKPAAPAPVPSKEPAPKAAEANRHAFRMIEFPNRLALVEDIFEAVASHSLGVVPEKL